MKPNPALNCITGSCIPLFKSSAQPSDIISLFSLLQKLQETLSKSWSDNEGQLCAGLSWERFTSVEQAKVCKIPHAMEPRLGAKIGFINPAIPPLLESLS